MGRKPLGRERINITLPKGMAQALLDVANAAGRDRSDVLEDLARGYLREKGVEWEVPVKIPAKKRGAR